MCVAQLTHNHFNSNGILFLMVSREKIETPTCGQLPFLIIEEEEKYKNGEKRERNENINKFSRI